MNKDKKEDMHIYSVLQERKKQAHYLAGDCRSEGMKPTQIGFWSEITPDEIMFKRFDKKDKFV